MSVTRVSVLTPPGTGAIATVAVVGPRAWEAVRAVFRPIKGSLPEVPPPHRVYFGVLGDGGDEVVVGVKSGDWVEVHCHGGRQVVRWVVDTLLVPLSRRGRGELTSVPSPHSPTPPRSALRPFCSTN